MQDESQNETSHKDIYMNDDVAQCTHLYGSIKPLISRVTISTLETLELAFHRYQ